MICATIPSLEAFPLQNGQELYTTSQWPDLRPKADARRSVNYLGT